ncbi:MAG: hypothetical protein ACPL06_01440 [Candidatus Anstonellales archaeon]
MPRGRRIVINQEIDDEWVDTFKEIDIDAIKKTRGQVEKGLSSTVAEVTREAQELYKRGKVEQSALRKTGLLDIQEAYEYLRAKGYLISFRAFGGRIERGTIPSTKVGKKRYIPTNILDDIVNLSKKFYTVREAYEEYRKANTGIKYRAFIGRVEKSSIPSVKIGTKRLIPKEAVDALTHIARNYYSVSEALAELHRNNITIRRNAFERRLDRGRIPHVKIGGRRFIPHNVMKELISKELALRRHGR